MTKIDLFTLFKQKTRVKIKAVRDETKNAVLSSLSYGSVFLDVTSNLYSTFQP